ncbi:MAG TPA: DUF4169 family protein [Verrucomicrobiae bacterium]|nr:DUF4169 family protein [Verrucomicrobiae bacterium]
MSNVVNFNKARKRKARAVAQAHAAANRIKFGRTQAEKARDEAGEEEARRKLDQLRLDHPPGD